MRCRSCNYDHSKVVDTYRNERNQDIIIRRRECTKCGVRFSTQEHVRDTKLNDYKTTPPNKILER